MASTDEKEAITSHLLDYGDECRFRPLMARDYGSRARGLAGPESDYDVFFIFAQPPAAYAIGGCRETYGKTIPPEDSLLDTEIELHGWNLRRFIGGDGLAGSNPTAIEFCASKEQYFQQNDANLLDPLFDMLTHAQHDFKPYALINHYRSLAASNYGKYVEQSWVREWSQEQFKEYTGIPGGQTAIDEDRGTITIGIIGYDEHTVEIPLDEARAEGMIRRTTRDPTIKRHLNIEQALIKARYIEEHHEFPPMDFPELLRDVSGSSWLPEHIYAEIAGQITKKKAGDGSKEIEYDKAIHDWIEDELSREIEPHGHVQRQPDRERINSRARELYNQLDWYGI